MIPSKLKQSVWASVANKSHTTLTRELSKVRGATIPTPHSPLPTPHKITIVGGGGKMGQLFTQELALSGHYVSILGREDWKNADRLLGEAELVIISVPIELTVDIIKRAATYLSSSTALVDLTSIKAEPVQAMLEYHCGPVMGLHPMFGPSVKSFCGEKVVVCPGRNDESFQWLLDLIRNKGGELIVSSPEEHDRMMVVIQATQHFSRLCFGTFLAESEIDINQSLSMSSPSYRQEIQIANRFFAQSPHLCADIVLATEERCSAICRLAEIYNRLAEMIKQKDRSALIAEFENTQKFFREQQNKSM